MHEGSSDMREGSQTPERCGAPGDEKASENSIRRKGVCGTAEIQHKNMKPLTDGKNRAIIAVVSNNHMKDGSEVRMHRVPQRRTASAEAVGRSAAPKGRGTAVNPGLGCRLNGSVTVIGRKSPSGALIRKIFPRRMLSGVFCRKVPRWNTMQTRCEK